TPTDGSCTSLEPSSHRSTPQRLHTLGFRTVLLDVPATHLPKHLPLTPLLKWTHTHIHIHIHTHTHTNIPPHSPPARAPVLPHVFHDGKHGGSQTSANMTSPSTGSRRDAMAHRSKGSQVFVQSDRKCVPV